MYARNVSMNLKPNSAREFTQTLQKAILPMLRKQNGFKDEITFVDSNGKDVLAISLWDRKESADQYSRETYPQVLSGLSRLLAGTPAVQEFEVSNSTWHKIASA